MNWMEAEAKDSQVGKRVGTSLYVHESALDELPPRLKSSSERALVASILHRSSNRTSFKSRSPNVVKFNWRTEVISWMVYEDFERFAHPRLLESFAVDPHGKVIHRDYRKRRSPPILHRKELFVSPTHPSRSVWEQLTDQEEKAGLFEEPSTIGTLGAWRRLLAVKGVRIEGHRLVRRD